MPTPIALAGELDTNRHTPYSAKGASPNLR